MYNEDSLTEQVRQHVRAGASNSIECNASITRAHCPPTLMEASVLATWASFFTVTAKRVPRVNIFLNEGCSFGEVKDWKNSLHKNLVEQVTFMIAQSTLEDPCVYNISVSAGGVSIVLIITRNQSSHISYLMGGRAGKYLANLVKRNTDSEDRRDHYKAEIKNVENQLNKRILVLQTEKEDLEIRERVAIEAMEEKTSQLLDMKKELVSALEFVELLESKITELNSINHNLHGSVIRAEGENEDLKRDVEAIANMDYENGLVDQLLFYRNEIRGLRQELAVYQKQLESSVRKLQVNNDNYKKKIKFLNETLDLSPIIKFQEKKIEYLESRVYTLMNRGALTVQEKDSIRRKLSMLRLSMQESLDETMVFLVTKRSILLSVVTETLPLRRDDDGEALGESVLGESVLGRPSRDLLQTFLGFPMDMEEITYVRNVLTSVERLVVMPTGMNAPSNNIYEKIV